MLRMRVSASVMSLRCGIVLKRHGFGGGEQAEVYGRGAGNEAMRAGVEKSSV